jgi:transcriptional regulator with XRE-family HTH domain
VDRVELADFLRRRRERLRPEDVGLDVGPRRRAPGLRREEVAALAGMSPDYYARMEQRRGPQPSEQMVAALARALRLTLDERDHLFRLTGRPAPARIKRAQHISLPLLRVFDRLADTPAMIVSDLADTLLQNRLAIALAGDQTHYTGLARSAYYRWFTDPAERGHFPERDHAHQSSVHAAGLRAALSAAGPDRRAREIVTRLLVSSPEFATVWARHEVRSRFDERKTLVHPELGEIEVDCQVLHIDNQAQTLLVLTAAPGSESDEKLRLLSGVGQEQLST